METNLEPGIMLTMEKLISEKDTAEHYGSGLIPVFATPAMIGLMESVAQMLVQPHLPEGYISLGIAINAKHTRATPVGRKVSCTARLDATEGKRFFFTITASDEQGEIGHATHTRAMVDADAFMERLR